MRILFVYKYEFEEPLGIMYLSSTLKSAGHECFFIDLEFEKEPIKEIKSISPDIIAYSIITGNHKHYQEFNLKLKREFNFFSIFGGPHSTFFPELIQEEGVDSICIGEGELAMLELANKLENKEDITQIKNLWLKLNNNIYKNEVRNLIEDLDILHFPDRELVNKYNHYKKLQRRYIITGRGCPYNCSYCFNHSFKKLYNGKGKIIRKRSVGNVINELRVLREKCNAKRFQMIDDVFILDFDWLREFCDLYKKEIHLPFDVYMRANLITEEIAKLLKDTGAVNGVFAIESGNDHIRNDILKKNITKEQIINSSKILHKYGFKIHIHNMVGLPDETLDMAFETMELNVKCKPDYCFVSIFQPYPKTDLCDYAVKRGYFNGDINSIGKNFHEKSIMKMNDIKKMERLHHLFPIGVDFPIAIPIIKILINFPLNKAYLLLWNLHKAWCYLFRMKWVDLTPFLIRK